MAGASLYPFEGHFKNVDGGHTAHWSEPFLGMLLHEGIQFGDLHIGETAVCLGERHKLVTIPNREREIREKIGPAAVSILGIDEYAVHGERIHLPLPPIPAFAPHAIRGIEPLEHESLALFIAGAGTLSGEVIARSGVYARR